MATFLQREDGDLAEAHEINVTPFIDVMLVLLIIFMVAAPLSTVDVAVDLPASTATPQPRPDKPLFVSVQSNLQLSLGDAPVAREALGAALDAESEGDKGARIFLRADRSVAYGDLMEVINLLRAGGYLKVALVGLESTMPAAQGEEGADAAGSRP
jgi:biopolymer transport protein ExbD